MALGVLCLIYTVFRTSINAEDVVKHVLVLYGCCLRGASMIRLRSLRMKLIFDFNLRSLILCMISFFNYLPLHEFFLYFPHPHPHQFSNGPSLSEFSTNLAQIWRECCQIV